MPPVRTIAKWTFASIKVCHRLLAVSAEVFCRHSFGERYLWELLAGFFFCWACSLCCEAAEPGRFPLFGFFVFCYFVLGCFHLVSIFRRRDGTVQSESCGVPFAFWGRITRSPLIVHIVLEPAMLGLAGFLLKEADAALSAWLRLSALCLFIKEVISAWNRRNHVLDVFDSRIEGERMNETVRGGANPGRGEEVHPTPVTQATAPTEGRPSLGQIFIRLDPALRRVLSEPPRPAPPVSPPHRPPQVIRPNQHGGPPRPTPRITPSPRTGQARRPR